LIKLFQKFGPRQGCRRQEAKEEPENVIPGESSQPKKQINIDKILETVTRLIDFY